MRSFVVAIALVVSSVTGVVAAQDASSPAAATKAAYTTDDTELGTLLDDPAARAVLDKHIPTIIKSENIDMARSMTLKTLQQYSPDTLTDTILAAIDADFAKLSAK